MKRLTVLLLMLGLAGCGGRAGEDSRAGSPQVRIPVEAEIVRLGPAVLEVSAAGSVAAREDVLLSTEAAGQVREVPVIVGDAVREGDVLVKLDDELATLAVQQADAQLLLAEAELESAEANLRRVSSLWKDGDISDADHEAAERGAKVARAGHMTALAARGSAGRQLRNTEIRSPFDGVVAFVYVERGQLVGVGTPAVHVIDSGTVEVEIGLNENQIVDVRRGARAKVRIRAYPGETFTGTVEYVGPKADDMTRAYPVRVVVPNPAGRLRSGMVAEVTLSAREFGDVVLVERDWVIDRFGEPSVFVVSDSVATVRRVSLGRIVGERVIVTSGLEPGDAVVSLGYDQLTDGAPVDVRNEVPEPDEQTE